MPIFALREDQGVRGGLTLLEDPGVLGTFGGCTVTPSSGDFDSTWRP